MSRKPSTDGLDPRIAEQVRQAALVAELSTLTEEELVARIARRRWYRTARRNQLLPHEVDPADITWNTCLWLAGRGFGKTRVGAEAVFGYMLENPGHRVGVIAPTSSDVRDTVFEGDSGLVNVIPSELIDTYNRSLGELIMTNGARIKGFSAEEPQRLRGPQHHLIWGDELAAWAYPEETMSQAEFGLRLGRNPRMILTTTPRPIAIIRDLVKQSREPNSTVRIIRGSTFDNKLNLSARFLKKMEDRYAGTRLGRQELDAEILDDTPGALWKLAQLDELRVQAPPCPMKRIVVGVDPPVTSNADSDECGIVVAGRGEDEHGYVLADRSEGGLTPSQWAQRVVDTFHEVRADAVVVETNNGGELVTDLLTRVGPNIPIIPVWASQGKFARAEPMSLLYERRRVHHVGCHAQLENQQTTYVPGLAKRSPDRLDALVWALTELFPYEQEVDISDVELFSAIKL